MPFDPTLPINDSIIDADELCGQFNGLNERIDGIPAGPAGADGERGEKGTRVTPARKPFANAVADNVNTVNPGENAQVGVSFDGTNVHFTFSIPRGSSVGYVESLRAALAR